MPPSSGRSSPNHSFHVGCHTPLHLVRVALDDRLGAQRHVRAIARAQAADVHLVVAIDLVGLVGIVGADEPQIAVGQPLVLQAHRTRAQRAVRPHADQHRRVELGEEREQLLLRAARLLLFRFGLHAGEDRSTVRPADNGGYSSQVRPPNHRS